MDFNTNFLDRTGNKNIRNSSPDTTGRVEFVVWHGTDSPNPQDTPATLNWALKNDGRRGAANFYIAQDGTVYWYIDEARFVAWHAGAGGAHARGYSGFQVNVHSIGVEIEERVSKKPKIPATAASLAKAAQLAVHINQKWGIPLDRAYHVGHKEIVNPGYRYDPDTYSIDAILTAARTIVATIPTPSYEVDARFQDAWRISGGIWQKNELTPGYPTGPAFEWRGATYQAFERGVARLGTDHQVSWLLIPEIIVLRQATGT